MKEKAHCASYIQNLSSRLQALNSIQSSSGYASDILPILNVIHTIEITIFTKKEVLFVDYGQIRPRIQIYQPTIDASDH